MLIKITSNKSSIYSYIFVFCPNLFSFWPEPAHLRLAYTIGSPSVNQTFITTRLAILTMTSNNITLHPSQRRGNTVADLTFTIKSSLHGDSQKHTHLLRIHGVVFVKWRKIKQAAVLTVKPGLLVIVLLSSSGGHVDYQASELINMARRPTTMYACAKSVQSISLYTSMVQTYGTDRYEIKGQPPVQ